MSTIEWFSLSVASAIVFGIAGLLMKASQARGGSTPHLLAGLYASGTILFVIHGMIAGHWDELNWWTLALGLIVGSGSAWGNDVFMKALTCGPASLTSPLTNMNVVLVVLMGTFWFAEPLSNWQMVAIGCLVIAIFLLAYKKTTGTAGDEPEQGKLPWAWFGFVAAGIILFALRNGGLKISQSMGLSNDTVLAIAYAWSLLWFAPPVLRMLHQQVKFNFTQNHTIRTSIPADWHSGWWWGIGTGICSYGGMQLYAYALSYGNVNVVAPVFATNSLVIALGSILLFGERLQRLQWVALLLIGMGLVWIRWTNG